MGCPYVPSMTEPGCVVSPSVTTAPGMPHFVPPQAPMVSHLPHAASQLAWTGANIEYLALLAGGLILFGALCLLPSWLRRTGRR